jgi:hypothetical protein
MEEENDGILLPNYKVVYLRDVLPNPFATGRSIDCNTPEGLLKAIDVLDDKFTDYEPVQFFICKFRSDDYVLLKLR